MSLHPSNAVRTLSVVALVAALAACGGDDDSPAGPQLGACQTPVNLFPTPVADASSAFNDVDDDFLLVPFNAAFDFSFFGTSYDGVYLNTNGGMTFGSGLDWYDEAVADIDVPSIAVFWGDLDAGGSAASVSRANQMTYQTCAAGFVVAYNQLQDHDEETWNNTATVTLEASGKITVQYGTVLSEDIAVGVWNGAHTDDRYVAVQNSYSSYASTGTGTVLFDDFGAGPTHAGQLTNRTITFNP